MSMGNQEINSALEKYGLTKNETSVYLACLELGPAKVNEISKKAHILRESTYGILKSLVEKGLTSYVIKSGVKYFESANPKKLKALLKEKEQMIERIIPDLENLQEFRVSKPKIEVYEGKEGIKSIMEDLLTSKTEILTLASNKHLNKLLEFYFPNFVRRRVKLGIKTKLLTDEEVLTKELIQYHYLPKNFEFDTAQYVYDDKIAIISLNQREPVGVLIQDRSISNSQRKIFYLLWKLAKK